MSKQPIRIPEIQDKDYNFEEVVSGLSNYKKLTKKFQSEILNGDIINELRKLDKNFKFDVIICDPPYNINKDFGDSQFNLEINKYVAWCKEWIDLCLEFLGENGLIYVYGFPEILARAASQYPVDKQRILAWHYTNKTTPLSKFWQRSYESILCMWKREKPHLEIDQIREPYTENYLKCSGKVRKGTKSRFGTKETIYNVNKKGALPRDVIKIPALAGVAGKVERHFMCKTCNNTLYKSNELKNHENHEIIQHPTQKPMQLTKRLIQSRINGNAGRTLIPFAGSGSECVAAKNLGIEFLGIELNPEYVKYANKWLEIIDKA